MAQDGQRAGPSAEDAFDPKKHDQLEQAIAQLSPEEAAFFLKRLEAAVTKRKIQLTGYLVAMIVWLAGMVGALVVFGTQEGFVGWVFLVPFALVGAVLWGFGRWSERVAGSVRGAGGDAVMPRAVARPQERAAESIGITEQAAAQEKRAAEK